MVDKREKKKSPGKNQIPEIVFWLTEASFRGTGKEARGVEFGKKINLFGET